MAALRLAILVCDTPMPSVKAVHGDYRQIFEALLASSLAPINASKPDQAQVTFTLDGYDVVTEMAYPPDEEEYDGLLLTGSAASAYEDIEWINKLVAYVQRIAAEKPKMKIFGICFGHQIIARALGGSCVQNNGLWEIAVTTIQLNALGKAIFGKDELVSPLYRKRYPGPAHFRLQDLQQMHRDHVPTSPPNSHILGSTSITPNHGMVIFYPWSAPPLEVLNSSSPNVPLSSIHILTVQGHPEFTEPIMSKLIDARVGILGEDLAADGRLRAGGISGRHHDGLACDGVGTVGKLFGECWVRLDWYFFWLPSYQCSWLYARVVI
ncbi:class I glutamine amidotransferase-like protein [Melanogaster broomeanus]|nr:class I glutamine amidotransferase-like protein [Melanogaster broomeanus]